MEACCCSRKNTLFVASWQGKYMQFSKNCKVLFWDFDGTLVDTREKNLQVFRKIFHRVTGRDFTRFPALQNAAEYNQLIRSYPNWREFYRKELGLTEAETDDAGRLWTEHHLEDRTPTPFFPGIRDVIDTLRGIPQGIISQNSAQSIRETLKIYNVLEFVSVIIGYEEVDIRRQKPAPDGLLMAIRELGIKNSTIFYVGDHEVDMICAQNANKILQQLQTDSRILTIGAIYSGISDIRNWQIQPDFEAVAAPDILKIVRGN